MKTRRSRVLEKIRRGEVATSLKINLSDPRVLEIAGIAGTDAVWLCNEHVPNDWIGLENQIRAARIHDVDTIVRVGRGSYSDYIKPMEADATGIIVPHVSSADEARQIVDWVRCYPVGRRPLDGGNVDGQFCELPVDDYIHHTNTERIVILQVESPEALERADEIAAVPGFNGILFGPGDFSHRLGKAGKLDDPEVVAARKRVAKIARKHGKFAMTAGLLAPFGELMEEGYQLFNVGADVYGLGQFFKQRLSLVAEGLKSVNSPAGTGTSPYGR